MAVGEAIVKVTADATGVEAGVTKAKKSLASLGQGAAQAGDKMTAANARTSKSIDQFIAKTERAADAVGKTATEVKLLELAQKGATAAQLKGAEAALKQLDALKDQEARTERLREKMTAFGQAAAVAFVAAGVAAAAYLRSQIDAVDQFNDLADATGASLESISALDQVARQNGHTFETVSGVLTKFNGILNNTDDEGQKAAQVLKAFGLDAKALKEADPAEALRQTAVAMSKFADDGNKARAVQLLFGKSIGEVAPLLADLASKTELVGTAGAKAAQEADIFNKHLFAVKSNATDAARSILADLLPALNSYLTAARGAGGLAGLLSLSGKQGEDPGKAINDITGRLDRLKKLRDELDPSRSFANSLNDRVFGDFEDASRQISLLEKQKAALQSLQSSSALNAAAGVDAGDAISRRQAARPSIGNIPSAPKGAGGAAPKDPDAEAKRYLESLQDRLQKTRELTVYETLLADLDRGKLAASKPLREQLELNAKALDASILAKKTEEEAAKAREKNAALNEASNEALRREIGTSVEANERLREELELLGLEGSARRAVEQARLSSAIALKEEALASEQNIEGNEIRVALLTQELELLKQKRDLTGQKGVKEDQIEAEKVQKEFSAGVRDDLADAFRAAFTAGTRNPIKAFGDALYTTVTGRVSAALSESLATTLLETLGLGPGGGGGGGLLGGLLGAPKASSGVPPNPFTSGGGGILSSIASFFGFGSFDRGTEFVPKDQLALIHRGERIVPAAENRRNGGMGGPVTVNVMVPSRTERQTRQQVASDTAMALRRAERFA